MKKGFAVLLIAALLCAAIPTALAETWYCPQCGNQNYYNFCPMCGTAKPVYPSSQTGGWSGSYTDYAYVTAVLNSRLASRTGPSTNYDEPGSFFSAGTSVTVLSRAYDSRNNIWWVQVEFYYSSSWYRVYTGVKRFNNLNLNAIPEEYQIGECKLAGSATGRYGPGTGYAAIKRALPAYASCAVYGYADGGNGDYVQIECYDSGLSQYRRAWVPVSAVSGLILY
jgi:hypothetical protein